MLSSFGSADKTPDTCCCRYSSLTQSQHDSLAVNSISLKSILMRHRTTERTRGFTLPEVLVTITLIAALAGVVVPAIAGQLKKGDPSLIGQDVAAIRSGVEQFLADVRRYPGAIQQVTAPITTSQSGLTTTMQGNYGAADVARWKGPYLTKDSIGVVTTGFGWVFKPGFEVDTLLPTGTS